MSQGKFKRLNKSRMRYGTRSNNVRNSRKADSLLDVKYLLEKLSKPNSKITSGIRRQCKELMIWLPNEFEVNELAEKCPELLEVTEDENF